MIAPECRIRKETLFYRSVSLAFGGFFLFTQLFMIFLLVKSILTILNAWVNEDLDWWAVLNMQFGLLLSDDIIKNFSERLLWFWCICIKKHLTYVLNCSMEEAKKNMYAFSTTTYTGFQCTVDEETSEKFRGQHVLRIFLSMFLPSLIIFCMGNNLFYLCRIAWSALGFTRFIHRCQEQGLWRQVIFLLWWKLQCLVKTAGSWLFPCPFRWQVH